MTIEKLSNIATKYKVFVKLTIGWDDRTNTQYVKLLLRKGELKYNIYIPAGSRDLSDVNTLVNNALAKFS